MMIGNNVGVGKASGQVITKKRKEKKTCPEGEKLVNGVCVPIEKPIEKPVPVSDLSRGVVTGYKTEEAQHKAEIAKILSEGGRKARTREELIAEGVVEPTPEEAKEILAPLEEAGVFEELPKKVELDPREEEKRQYIEGKEIVDVEGDIITKSPVVQRVKQLLSKNTDLEEREINSLIQNPETQRQVMLSEIQREELNKVSTSSQKLGALLEPYIGDLKLFDVDIGGYANKFARMPQQEVEEIVEQIKEVQGRISGMTDSVSQGEMGNPFVALRTIAEEEVKIYKYEARIKRLIIESEELRANPEKVNIIEEQILSAKIDIYEAKQRAAEGAVITPQTESLYFKLQKYKK